MARAEPARQPCPILKRDEADILFIAANVALVARSLGSTGRKKTCSGKSQLSN